MCLQTCTLIFAHLGFYITYFVTVMYLAYVLIWVKNVNPWLKRVYLAIRKINTSYNERKDSK
nr:MAG TPA: hypothetical protein [Caudoviricetes sp.]